MLVLGEGDSCALFLTRPLDGVALDPRRLAAALAQRGLRLVGISAAPACVRSSNGASASVRSEDELVARLFAALDAVGCR